jgi:uncharacterized protein
MHTEGGSDSKIGDKTAFALIPRTAIRSYARQIANHFQPEQVILFGSYAFGTPNRDSDVDLLVIMPCRNELDMAVKISINLPAPFPMDLIVRKPEEWRRRLKEGESFSKQIRTDGKVLYAKGDSRMDKKSRSRPPRCPRT